MEKKNKNKFIDINKAVVFKLVSRDSEDPSNK